MTRSRINQKKNHPFGGAEKESSARCSEFMRYYSVSYPQVYRYIFSLVPRKSDADEVIQEASVILWEKFEEFQPDRDFTRWACGIARLAVLELMRKQKSFLTGFDEQLVKQLAFRQEEQYELMELRQEFLEECKEKLPGKDIQLISCFYDSKTGAQKAATQRNCTLRNIYQQIERIRKVLFRCIERKIAEEGGE